MIRKGYIHARETTRVLLALKRRNITHEYAWVHERLVSMRPMGSLPAIDRERKGKLLVALRSRQQS
jgi:hypothetical protein